MEPLIKVLVAIFGFLFFGGLGVLVYATIGPNAPSHQALLLAGILSILVSLVPLISALIYHCYRKVVTRAEVLPEEELNPYDIYRLQPYAQIMSVSYYDVDSILTDAQKVPCTFSLDIPHLGHLDGSSTSSTLTSGTTLSLPLWLATLLAVSSPSTSTTLLTLDLPNALSPSVINALKASPLTVDLRAQAAQFYGLGVRMLDLFEEEEVLDVLVESFRARAVEIGDQASNVGGAGGMGGGAGGSAGVDFLRGLDEWERALFRTKHEAAKDLRKWMNDAKKK